MHGFERANFHERKFCNFVVSRKICESLFHENIHKFLKSRKRKKSENLEILV